MKEIRILWSKFQEPATFDVLKETEVIFEGESSLPDTYIGWGIAEGIKKEGIRAIVRINQDEDIELPEGYRLNRGGDDV